MAESTPRNSTSSTSSPRSAAKVQPAYRRKPKAERRPQRRELRKLRRDARHALKAMRKRDPQQAELLDQMQETVDRLHVFDEGEIEGFEPYVEIRTWHGPTPDRVHMSARFVATHDEV